MAQARNWLGTLNNPDTTTTEVYLKRWKDTLDCQYVNGQLEKGSEGTVHIQYFLHFASNKRLSALKKVCAKSHFEPVKYDNGASDYCLKEDTRVEGPWEFGLKPAQLNKKGSKAEQNAKLIEMGAEEAVKQGLISVDRYLNFKKNIDAFKIATKPALEADDVRGIWIWGPPGVGKSRYARDNYQDIYLKAQNKWWDGYTVQKTVLLDDHDSPCLGHYLKIWMDRYACNGESKGSTVPLHHTVFIVTSNYSPEQLYEKDGTEMVEAIRRRCKVIHMTEPFK